MAASSPKEIAQELAQTWMVRDFEVVTKPKKTAVDKRPLSERIEEALIRYATSRVNAVCPGCRQNVAFCDQCKAKIRNEALEEAANLVMACSTHEAALTALKGTRE